MEISLQPPAVCGEEASFLFKGRKMQQARIILEAEGVDEKNCLFLMIVLEFTYDYFYI